MDTERKSSGRLLSLDTLRGFDMFFIMGGAGFIAGLCSALGCGNSWLAQQMSHVPWTGIAHHDTIFPLFLFLAGVSWPFSLAAQRERGRTSLQILLKLLGRVVALFLIGLSFGGILRWSPTFRLSSVLGFIGLSWGVAALLFLHVEKTWKRIAVFAAIAIGYFALLHFGVASGAPADADTYSKEWNIVAAIDRALWPNHLWRKGVYDPESLMSLPGGVLVALLGMTAGSILRCGRFTPGRKVLVLAGASLASLAVDLVLVFGVGVPIVKALWSVSFVFAASTYGFAMLALFYWIIDVRGWTRWTVLFDCVGKNPILVYTLSMIGVTRCLSTFLFGGTCDHCGAWKAASIGLSVYLVSWCIARFCQKKNIYLKV